MKSSKLGESTSVSVENITPFGIWLYTKDKEYFLSYQDYPYFKNQTLNSIQNVELHHGFHLYWPELDVDLEIDNLENPEKYPLKYKTLIEQQVRLSRGERVILETLLELGGRASHDDLFKAYMEKMKPLSTEDDYQKLPSGAEIRWRNTAMRERIKLIKEGLLKSESPDGIWELSNKGTEEVNRLV